jgi:LmbE family N-acetylglucosaminyl deacetylase
VRRLYLFWSERPDAWVDIGATVDRKLAALAEHRSQIHDWARLDRHIRQWAAEEGSSIGAAAAEALRVIVIDEDDGDMSDEDESHG